MRPIAAMTSGAASRIEAIFTDIDGTITDAEGRIPSRVFRTMEQARRAGLVIVPITGRPAGWCDMIARTWPVDGVVGENGGLYFRRQEVDGTERMARVFAQPEETRRANRARTAEVARRVLGAHPGARLASDQQYREFDIAIDFCEDVPPLPPTEIDGIVAICEAAGMHVKVSNIHVNAWFGEFDKASMCRRYVADRWEWDLDGADSARAAFFGDSPNDSPLFGLFEVGIGVANVARMTHRMQALPSFLCDCEGCDGFIEGVEMILALRPT